MKQKNFKTIHLFLCRILLVLVFSCSLFWVDYLKKKAGFYVIFGMIFITIYRFMYGCFESMDFCVSHTFFISSFTSFTSAA